MLLCETERMRALIKSTVVVVAVALFASACGGGGTQSEVADSEQTVADESVSTSDADQGDDASDESNQAVDDASQASDDTNAGSTDEGGDDGVASDVDATPTADAYIESAVTIFEDDPEFFLGGDEAVCFASRLVEIITLEALVDGGVTPEEFGESGLAGLGGEGFPVELSQGQAEDMASLMLDGECFDYVDLMFGDPAATGEMSDEARMCFADAFAGSDLLREAAVQQYLGVEPTEEQAGEMLGLMFQFMGECGELG